MAGAAGVVIANNDISGFFKMGRRRGDYDGDQDVGRVQGSICRGFDVFFFQGYGIWRYGEGFSVKGSHFKVLGLGLKDNGLGFRV